MVSLSTADVVVLCGLPGPIQIQARLDAVAGDAPQLGRPIRRRSEDIPRRRGNDKTTAVV